MDTSLDRAIDEMAGTDPAQPEESKRAPRKVYPDIDEPMLPWEQRRALGYLNRFGFTVVPLLPGSKKPARASWSENLLTTREAVLAAFTQRGNIGVICGEASGNLIDIDLDDPDALALAPSFLPATGFVFGRKSNPASHRFYRTDTTPPAYCKLTFEKACLVEFRSTGSQYTVLPDSVHDEGERYEFTLPKPAAKGDIALVDGVELRTKVHELAAAAVLLKVYPRGAGQRHDIALALGGTLARLGWSQEKAQSFLAPVLRMAGDQESDDRMRAIADAFARHAAGDKTYGFPRLRELLGEGVAAMEKILGTGAPAPEESTAKAPAINVQHEVAPMQARLEELLAKDGGIYQRAGKMVRLVKDDDGHEQIAELPASTLYMLASRYRWLRTTAGDDGKPKVKRVDPLRTVLDALMDQKRWSLPILRGVTTTPTLLPDGQVLDQPGYHAGSGIFYAPTIAFDPVPEKVTKDEALAHLQKILDIFQDFPFKTNDPKNPIAGHDRAAVVAMVLTQLLRPAIDGPVPLFLVRAPVAGSGKSFIPDLVSILATGAPALCYAYPKGNEDEVRKTLFTLALEGKPLVCFDNMTGSVKSPALNMYLTSRTFGARVLTTMTAGEAPAKVVLYMTGNNVRAVGDLARRTISVEIDPGCARPEFREGFKHADLRGYVRDNRKTLVPAVLAVVRGYQQAAETEKPKTKSIGSYDAWSAMVRAPLLWLGLPDPGQSLLDARKESDDDETVKTALLESWLTWRSRARRQDKPDTARSVTAKALLATHDQDLKEAIVEALHEAKFDQYGNIQGVKAGDLGPYLASIKDRIFAVEGMTLDGEKYAALRLVRDTTKRDKAGALWKVEALNEKGQVLPLVASQDRMA